MKTSNAPSPFKLMKTTDYGMFESHSSNRPSHDDRKLETSMRLHGFLPSHPIHCRHNGNGKLKVIAGHHRLHYAQKLNIPVFYVIDDTDVDIYELEGSSKQQWSVSDFLRSRAESDCPACEEVVKLANDYGITDGSAIDLLANQTSISGNKVNAVKMGTFSITDEGRKFAHSVCELSAALSDLGVIVAKRRSFISALAMCFRYDAFDPDRLLKRARRAGYRIGVRSRAADYLDEIEFIYNFGSSPSDKVALALGASAATAARNAARKG